MYYVHTVEDFLISSWIWHFTWGWGQVIINALLCWFFVSVLSHMSWLRAALLVLMAHIVTSVVFSACIFLIAHVCEPDMSQTDSYMIVYTNPLLATASFAALYAGLLMLFCVLFNYAYTLPLARVCLAITLAAILSTCVTTWFIML